MDDNNKVQVTEIFDVTDSESHTMLSIDEVNANTRLQFDDWDEPTWLSQHMFNDGKLFGIFFIKLTRSIYDQYFNINHRMILIGAIFQSKFYKHRNLFPLLKLGYRIFKDSKDIKIPQFLFSYFDSRMLNRIKLRILFFIFFACFFCSKIISWKM